MGSPSSSGLLGESAAEGGALSSLGSPPRSVGCHPHCPACVLAVHAPSPPPSVQVATNPGTGVKRCHHRLRAVEDECVAPPTSWGSSLVFLI